MLGVEYSEQPVSESESPRLAAIDAQIEALRRELEELVQERGLIEAQEDFIDALTTRAAGEASEWWCPDPFRPG